MGVQKPLKNYWSLLVMGVIGSIGATCLSVMAQAVLVDPEYVQTAQNMYSADDGNTEVLYFKNAIATFYSFTHEPQVVKF